MKTILGLYDDISNVDRLLDPLMQDGIDADHVEVVTSSKAKKEFQKNSHFSNLVHDYKAGTLHTELAKRGIPTGDAYFFEQGVEQGNTLVILEVDDDRAPRILQQMKQGEARLGQSDITNAPSPSAPRKAASLDSDRSIPVIEEELRISKEVRQTGGVEVERKVSSRPVHQEVDLIEEHVEVSRHSANRPASKEDLEGAFEEGSFEMREQREELIVEKEPRVVEEVQLHKTVEHKKQSVDETLRRVDVNIHEIEQRASEDLRFDTMRNDYRSHFDSTYKSAGNRYEDFEDAYRFGHGHALREDWRTHDFQTVSPHLKSDYEQRHGAGAWDRARGAVEHAWNSVRARF